MVLLRIYSSHNNHYSYTSPLGAIWTVAEIADALSVSLDIDMRHSRKAVCCIVPKCHRVV
ncbi:hypothetical protein [Bartonella sp. CB60]|uniref:hypothetical protein n=1 Tax=Bartonella sp. CB60 TaxID=3113619 RepID=UPI00300DFA30